MARRRLEVEIVGNARQLERTLGKTETRLQAFGKRANKATGGVLGSVGPGKAILGGLVGAEALNQVRHAVSAASDLNEQVSKSQVVFGRSAGDIRSWSETTSKSFGISQRAALEAAGTFGTITRSMGFTESSAAEMSRGLVNLAGDLASFNNVATDDALLALRSAIVGEYDPLRRLGSALSETRVQKQAMIETGKRNAKELTNQEKVTARYNLILKDTSLAQGDAARTADSFANQTRQLSAKTEDLKAKIGSALLPEISYLVDTLNDATDSAIGLSDALKAIADFKAPDISKLKLPALTPPSGPEPPKTGNPVYDRIFGDVYNWTMDKLRDLGLAHVSYPGVPGNVPDPSGGLNLPKTKPTKKPDKMFGGKAKAPVLMTELPVGFENTILRAQNEDDRGAYLKALIEGRQQLDKQLKNALEFKDSDAVNKIRGNLLSVQSAIQGVYAEMAAETARTKAETEAAAAKTKAEAASALRQSLDDEETALQTQLVKDGASDAERKRLIAFYRRESHDKRLTRSEQLQYALQLAQAVESFEDAVASRFKKQAEELKKQGATFKSDALAKLDRKQSRRDVDRELTDATRNLAFMRGVGGQALVEARRRLEDAQLAKQRFMLEGATVTGSQATGFTISGSTFVFHGVKNVPELISQLQKVAKQQPAQPRGRTGARRLGLD